MALEKHIWSRKEGKQADRRLRRQEDRITAEDREAPTEAARKRRKAKRPFGIEAKWAWHSTDPGRWLMWRRYESAARREQAFAQLQKAHPHMKFRLAA